MWPITDKPLYGDDVKIRKALVPVLASFFMTRHGFTQAQVQLSHHEYTRIFDDLSLREETIRSTDHYRKLSPLDFEAEIKQIMGVPFRA